MAKSADFKLKHNHVLQAPLLVLAGGKMGKPPAREDGEPYCLDVNDRPPVQLCFDIAQGSSDPLRPTDPDWTVTEDRLDERATLKNMVGGDKQGLASDLPLDDCPKVREVRAEPVSDNVGLPIKYLGNGFSGKFHRPSCPFARAMNARHVVFFHFRREAIECGQLPCRYCLPPVVKRLECKLLPRGKAEIVTTSKADFEHSEAAASH